MELRELIDLFFGGMAKLGPSDDAETLRVLRSLPATHFKNVVDAGCGTGQHTLVLARELKTVVHALDTHPPFLAALERRAQETGLEPYVQTHCLDMQEIPKTFSDIDLLWSEGSAYNIGFPHALEIWRPAIRSEGFAVVSELSWLKQSIPPAVAEFFRAGYPQMKSVAENSAIAQQAGYRLLTTHTLPRRAWIDGYYDVLEPRAHQHLEHPDPTVRDFAAGILQEIQALNDSDDSYGYVFFVLQRQR